MDTSHTKLKVTPKDFFLWLGAMVALYVSATSLILLIHQYINVLFPSALDYPQADPYSGSIRFAIASLIVVFPAYIWLTRMLNQDIRTSPAKSELWVRKWLVYITLFIAGSTIIGDLIALVYTFLEGELTTRFSLKALTILIVLGGGFWYYLASLRGVWEEKESLSKTIGVVVAVAVFVSVAAGFFIIGSPMTQRLIQLDFKKEQDLQSLQWQILNFWQLKEKLPASLEELEDDFGGFISPVDSETGKPYGYKVTGPMTFEICATFNLESTSATTYPITSEPVKGFENETWKHGAGEHCFERVIDPERYPPYTNASKTPSSTIR